MPDNLPELRDIHLPDGVSIWPPAIGWLLLLIGIVVVWGIYRLIVQVRRKSKKRYALKLLDGIFCNNSIKSAAEMSEILRRICVSRFPEAAVLQGKDWIDFLNSHSEKKLDEKTAQLLLNAPYMPDSAKGFETADVVALRVFCRSFIGENL